MLSWPDFDIMSFGCSYSMSMYVCILGLALFYSWDVFGTGYLVTAKIVRCRILGTTGTGTKVMETIVSRGQTTFFCRWVGRKKGLVRFESHTHLDTTQIIG